MKISFDLDDVLFVSPDRYETEKPLPFPFDRLFPDRLRKGTIYLMKKLKEEGFEVWIYTSSNRPQPYIKSLFRRYGIELDGIVNSSRHLREVQRDKAKLLPSKLPSFYQISLHVDDEDVTHQNGRVYGFRTMKVHEPDPQWADKVLKEARRIQKLG